MATIPRWVPGDSDEERLRVYSEFLDIYYDPRNPVRGRTALRNLVAYSVMAASITVAYAFEPGMEFFDYFRFGRL